MKIRGAEVLTIDCTVKASPFWCERCQTWNRLAPLLRSWPRPVTAFVERLWLPKFLVTVERVK